MYTQVDKPKENKSSAVANSVAQKKNNSKQGFGFVDNRSVGIAQKGLQLRKRRSPLPGRAVEAVQKLSMYLTPEAEPYIESLAKSRTGLFHKEMGIAFGTMSFQSTSDSTLTLWGHGSAGKFGSHNKAYTPLELLKVLGDLGLKESKIKNIELLSCASSSEYQLNTNVEDMESYGSALQKLINNIGDYSKLGIKVKVLPTPKVKGQNSILHGFKHIDKFIYITASNDFIEMYKTEVGKLSSKAPQGSDLTIRDNYMYKNAVSWCKSQKAISFITNSVSKLPSYMNSAEIVG